MNVSMYEFNLSIFVFVLGPFTRPHPAIWRIVFGELCVDESVTISFPFSCTLLCVIFRSQK